MKTIFFSSLLILMSITVSAQDPVINKAKAKAAIEAQIASLHLNEHQKFISKR